MTSARPAQQDADDYESILAAVMETARGRWFVAEFARRNRQIETATVLDALNRIERRLAGGASAHARHPDLDDLAAIFAVRDNAGAPGDGLTENVVAEIAREIGGGSETIRDHLLKARGALKGLTDAGGDQRLCAALDRAMVDIDKLAAGQGDAGRRIEALAQVIGTIRDRLRRLIESDAAKPAIDPWIVTPEAAPDSEDVFHGADDHTPFIEPVVEPLAATPPAADEPVLFEDEPAPALPAFQGGLPIEPVAPGARLRLAIADEERNILDLPPPAVKPPPRAISGGPRTAAELDRLNYSERYALFAS